MGGVDRDYFGEKIASAQSGKNPEKWWLGIIVIGL